MLSRFCSIDPDYDLKNKLIIIKSSLTTLHPLLFYSICCRLFFFLFQLYKKNEIVFHFLVYHTFKEFNNTKYFFIYFQKI